MLSLEVEGLDLAPPIFMLILPKIWYLMTILVKISIAVLTKFTTAFNLNTLCFLDSKTKSFTL